MSDDTDAACAHLTLHYDPTDMGGGSVRERWSCDSCNAAFLSVARHDWELAALRARLADVGRERDQLLARVAEVERGYGRWQQAAEQMGQEVRMLRKKLHPDIINDDAFDEVRAEAETLRARVVAFERERAAARRGRRGWDELCSIVATTADRLNVALRESGCVEMIGDPYHSLALRDGIVALYACGARCRMSLDRAKDALKAAADRETALIARAADLAVIVEAVRIALRGHTEDCSARQEFLGFRAAPSDVLDQFSRAQLMEYVAGVQEDADACPTQNDREAAALAREYANVVTPEELLSVARTATSCPIVLALLERDRIAREALKRLMVGVLSERNENPDARRLPSMDAAYAEARAALAWPEEPAARGEHERRRKTEGDHE